MSAEKGGLPASVIWMRPVRGSRGPQPSRDRDTIARTAIAIADREGIAAVSMRRVAAEIGSGTSSLYRYFARKDDLLNLMVDGALASAEFSSTNDWRKDLRQMGDSIRSLFNAHPWLATTLAGRPTLGPNRLRALELALGVLAGTGLSLRERFTLVDALTSYVRGFVASEIADAAAIRDSGLTPEQWRADQAAYSEAIRQSGAYPLSTSLFEELRSATPTGPQDDGFEAGLDILLDGIALRLSQHSPTRPR